MKFFVFGGLALIAAAVTWYRWRFASHKRPVSPQWLVDADRRQWTEGIEGPCWQFPVNKAQNEASNWNSRRLRHRA